MGVVQTKVTEIKGQSASELIDPIQIIDQFILNMRPLLTCNRVQLNILSFIWPLCMLFLRSIFSIFIAAIFEWSPSHCSSWLPVFSNDVICPHPLSSCSPFSVHAPPTPEIFQL